MNVAPYTAERFEHTRLGVRARVRMTDAAGWLEAFYPDAGHHHWCLTGVQFDGDDRVLAVGVLPHLQGRPTHGLSDEMQAALSDGFDAWILEQRRAA